MTAREELLADGLGWILPDAQQRLPRYRASLATTDVAIVYFVDKTGKEATTYGRSGETTELLYAQVLDRVPAALEILLWIAERAARPGTVPVIIVTHVGKTYLIALPDVAPDPLPAVPHEALKINTRAVTGVN